jgi:hypothetical protein
MFIIKNIKIININSVHIGGYIGMQLVASSHPYWISGDFR